MLDVMSSALAAYLATDRKVAGERDPDRDPFTPPDHEFWIETASGRCFDLLDPRPEDVAIEDVAAHLSMLCRFTGASGRLYTVAEHSLWALEVARMRSFDEDVCRWALLHDAAEAYVGDVSRPLKKLIGARYTDIEGLVERAIVDALGLRPGVMPDSVKAIDRELLTLESLVFLPRGGEGWTDHVRTALNIPIDDETAFGGPKMVEALFLEACHELAPGGAPDRETGTPRTSAPGVGSLAPRDATKEDDMALFRVDATVRIPIYVEADDAHQALALAQAGAIDPLADERGAEPISMDVHEVRGVLRGGR